MGANEIQELDEAKEGMLQRQRELEAEKKRQKLAEDMEKEQKERIRKKQELLRKEKDLEKVITYSSNGTPQCRHLKSQNSLRMTKYSIARCVSTYRLCVWRA